MIQPGRKYASSSSKYRYGFNGKENDNDISKGEGGQQDYGMRVYDTRLGKFLSVDPLNHLYPWYTPYQFAGNKPIQCIDLDGLEEYYVLIQRQKNGDRKFLIQYTTSDKNGKNLVNMQLQKVMGASQNGEQNLGGRLTEQRVVRILTDADGNTESVEFSSKLNDEEKETLLNSKKDGNDGLYFEATIDDELYESKIGSRRSGLDQDWKAQKTFAPLVKSKYKGVSSAINIDPKFSSTNGNLEVSLMPGLEELPILIKKDGGIKSIDINIGYYMLASLTRSEEKSIKEGFNRALVKLQKHLAKSGLKKEDIRINLDIRTTGLSGSDRPTDIPNEIILNR